MKRSLILTLLAISLLCGAPAFAQDNAAPQTLGAEQPRSITPNELFALMAGEAEKGNAQAMLQLGVLYERGIGTGLNYSKALEWYGKAAAAGSVEGHYNVGICYEIGMGTAANPAQAIASFERAAIQGLGIASYKLAAIYFSGIYVPRDETRGVSYLKAAADANYAPAANEMGIVYLQGQFGQKQDDKQALAMFTRAANLGNLEAVKNLAVIYKDGLGQKANAQTALMWYIIAQKGGYPADLAPFMDTLRASLNQTQIDKAEADANAWIAAYEQRMAGNQ